MIVVTYLQPTGVEPRQIDRDCRPAVQTIESAGPLTVFYSVPYLERTEYGAYGEWTE
jgi:hypothetical protein